MFIYGYIYGLRCKANGKWYIGQTTEDPYRYINYNYGKSKAKGRPKLDSALKKHGYKGFDICILDSAYNIAELNLLEIEYIKFYDSMKNGYNCTSGGMQFGQFSEETIEKISNGVRAYWDNITPEEYEAYCESLRGENHPMFGKNHTEESKELQRIANTGKVAWNKGLEMTPEYCEKHIASGENHYMWGKYGENNHRFGVPQSESAKKAMSIAHMGKTPWNKGLEMTPEYCKNLSGENNHRWGKTEGGNSKKVEVDGIIYVNKKAAYKALNCSYRTFPKRYPNYKVLPKDQ